jgi:hypothetical protein
MGLLRCLYAKLRLKVNESKSAVGSDFGRKFLGYSLWAARGKVVKLTVADKPLATFRQRIRETTGRFEGGAQHAPSRRPIACLPAGTAVAGGAMRIGC